MKTEDLAWLAERLDEADKPSNIKEYETLVKVDGKAMWTVVHAEAEDRALAIAHRLYGRDSILRKPKKR